MGPNRVFFPQDSLDQWIGEGKVDLLGNELVIRAENRRYRVVEAVRIVTEVTGTFDGNELVGKVKSLSFLGELGAEILGTSMVLGENAYEVIPGFMGTACSVVSAAGATNLNPREGGLPKSEEALLVQYLLRTLE